MPIVSPDKAKLEKPTDGGLQATWIGHATILVQMDGINVLTDPVFSARCSPSQYFGPKRYRKVPITIAQLPDIHAVVISHNHYDHLDYDSVKQLNAKFGAGLTWFVPMGMAEWMRSLHCDNVVELDWWGEHVMSSHPNITVILTPAQHWSKRTVLDDNKVLNL